MAEPTEPADPAKAPAEEKHTQKWRFRVRRKSDGTELIGPVVDLPWVPVKLPPPVWAHDDNPNDSEAPLEVAVSGNEGRTVRFTVEEEDGRGGWVVLQIAEAKVSGGKATVMIKLAHPEGQSEPDLTPDPIPEDGAEPPPPIDPKAHEGHAVRAKAELL